MFHITKKIQAGRGFSKCFLSLIVLVRHNDALLYNLHWCIHKLKSTNALTNITHLFRLFLLYATPMLLYLLHIDSTFLVVCRTDAFLVYVRTIRTFHHMQHRCNYKYYAPSHSIFMAHRCLYNLYASIFVLPCAKKG